MLDHMAAENAGAAPLGSVGAVVGATLGDAGVDLAINGPLLAPGIGAQGATPADLPAVFGDAVGNVVPSVSRGVLRHGPDVSGLREAAERFADEVRGAVSGKLTLARLQRVDEILMRNLVDMSGKSWSAWLTRTFRLFSLTTAALAASLRRERPSTVCSPLTWWVASSFPAGPYPTDRHPR